MRNPWLRFVLASAFASSVGCRVYNPDLLHRDGSRDGSDAAVDGADVTVDGPVVTDGGDAHDSGNDDVLLVDASDAPTDTPIAATCATLLAAGTPCIEPFTGHNAPADDPRLLSPFSIAVSADSNPLVAIGDLGTGRVLGYAQDGTMPVRLAGTGIVAVPAADGPALSTSLASPSSSVFLPSGDLVIGDSIAHTLYLLRRGVGRLERYGTLSFQEGPNALGLLDTNTLLVAADNRIYTVNIASGTPGAPTAFAGCGLGCRGFNATAMAGNQTLFDSPTGVDADASYVYIADSRNCRIRRVARASSNMTVTVFAGTTCDPRADILGGTGQPIAAGMAHLGPIGDVKVGFNGFVYFTDPTSHCAILEVPTSGPLANQVRVVAGSSMGCGVVGTGGVALGRLGALGISDDRTTLFFVEAQSQRIGRIQLNGPGGAGLPTFAISPGATPGMTETAEHWRAGGVSGLATTGSEADPTVYWAGGLEQRVYRSSSSGLAIYTGNGRQRLIPPIPAANLEPSVFAGLGYGDGRLVMGLQSHAAVAAAMGTAVFRVAGTYDVSGEPTGAGAATSDPITAPAWPIIHSSNLYFGSQGPAPRVYRVAALDGTTPIVPVAGVGSGDGGVPTGGNSVPATSAAIARPAGLAFDASDNLYIADPVSHVVWRASAGTISIVAGLHNQLTPLDDAENDALGVAIPDPQGLAFDGAHTLYIADRATHRIRAFDTVSLRMRTVAGAGTDARDFIAASTSAIGEVSALSTLGNRVYFGEWDTGRVRVLRMAP